MGRVKDIVWDSKNVAFFWSTYVNDSKNIGAWMSEGSGRAISSQMKRILPRAFFFTPKVLCDWGCGTGNFAAGLVTSGHKVYGVDQPEVITEIENYPSNFMPLTDSKLIPNQEIDLLYALEVIEHIIESQIPKTFLEWRRILNPGGYLLITTPNSENLESNSIVCPNCETKFHSVQHVRSISPGSITKMLLDYGFQVERIWLGEFFFETKKGAVVEKLRKIWYWIRRIRARKEIKTNSPHMMVLAKLI